MPKRIKEIHRSIRSCLGYGIDESVSNVLKDWKARTTTVCKPCWELKYCPYGPLVEQLPLLPATLVETEAHNTYLKKCLETNLIGEERSLDEFSTERLKRILSDEEFAEQAAISEVDNEICFENAALSDESMRTLFGGSLPPLEVYRVPFEAETKLEIDPHASSALKLRIANKTAELKRQARAALQAGVEDNRKPLDVTRRKMFQEQLDNFKKTDHPPEIPEIFREASCNIFGHICPVFFAAESISETSEARRRGRYISFSVKMRVVRRDNHTCQECGVHLRDDEVELDHKIPLSKGGSTEEHNIRLTCFDCNRDKSARVDL